MNILISSAMLAMAILMVAHSIGELRPARKQERKKPKPVRNQRRHAPADWDRILKETELRQPKRKVAK